jgi:hypothetical protein
VRGFQSLTTKQKSQSASMSTTSSLLTTHPHTHTHTHTHTQTHGLFPLDQSFLRRCLSLFLVLIASEYIPQSPLNNHEPHSPRFLDEGFCLTAKISWITKNNENRSLAPPLVGKCNPAKVHPRQLVLPRNGVLHGSSLLAVFSWRRDATG